MTAAAALEWLREHARWADALDVLITALLVYAGLRWLRTARSRFVVLGVALLGGVYALSRALDLYLTLMVFQAGLAVAVLALVVIFQEEIRRAFERLATGGPLLTPRRPRDPSAVIQVLVRSLPELAAQKVGALVVWRGREPLERHLSGGVPLEGKPSEALLASIFDSSSAGHDGAVVIEGDCITRFGVHLPLARTLPPGFRHGTRHTAALGLAERSDALVLVVSEERGQVSVAEAGRLTPVDTDQLRERLLAFSERVGGAAAPPRARAAEFGLRVLALAIAAALWVMLVGHRSDSVARAYTVPVAVRGAPAELFLGEPEPAEVRVTLSGSSRAFLLLDPSQLQLVLDGTGVRAGSQAVALTAALLDHPDDVRVESFQPAKVTLTARETMRLTLPVKADLVGEPPPTHRLGTLEVTPARIAVILPRGEKTRPAALRTAPIDMSELRGRARLERALVLPPGTRLAPDQPETVVVEVDVEERPPQPGRPAP